jgi:hypothetical protein
MLEHLATRIKRKSDRGSYEARKGVGSMNRKILILRKGQIQTEMLGPEDNSDSLIHE